MRTKHSRAFCIPCIALTKGSFLKIVLTMFCMVIAMNLSAQSTGSIKGRVLDKNEVPVPNMNVILLGTSNITTTDNNGQFSFDNINSGTYSIQVSSIGFESQVQEVSVKNDQTSDIAFEIYEKVSELGRVEVIGRKVSYVEPLSSISTRTSIPLKDLAQSVQAIPRTILNEQQAFKLNEGYRNAAGILEVNTLNDYVIRGFRKGKTNFLMNGQMGAMTYENPPMLFNAEKVEVLRGPSAILFGYATPGGVVNFITKKPLDVYYNNINISGGSFNTFHFQSDFTGPLNKKKTLLYRLNVGYENAGNPVDHLQVEYLAVAPSLMWKISDKTSLLSEFSYMKDNRTICYENGYPAFNGDVFSVKQSLAVHEPDDYSERDGYQMQLNFKHYFSKNVIFNTLVNYNKIKADAEYLITWDSPDENGDLPRVIERMTQDHDIISVNTYLENNFSIGSVKNKVLAGVDFYYYSEAYPNYKNASAPSINIFRPVYGTVDKANCPNDIYDTDVWEYKTRTFAGYIQDHITISEKIKGVIGVRFEDYHYKMIYEEGGEAYNDTSDAFSCVPRLGLIYQPTKNLSLYGSYSVGFEPQKSNYPNNGGPFDPETSSQYEVGIKSDLFNKRIMTTLALYDIIKENVLTPDKNDPTGRKRVQKGQVKSKGVELSITGNITDNWSILFNYAYNNIEVTKSNVESEVGKTFGNAPKNISNLWTTYKVNNGVLKGLKFGGGFRYVDKRIPYTLDDLTLPAYTIVDGMISYTIKNATISFNIYNIADKEHVLGAYSSWQLRPGTPRSIRIGFNYTF